MGSLTRLTITMHAPYDPECSMFNGGRVPAWLRALLIWNCYTCRTQKETPNAD